MQAMNAPVIVVSGLPRSGTSLLMQMLQAGGLPLVTDQARRPDTDNPRGYFEDERVKRLDEDDSWLDQARGRVVKVVSPLLAELPDRLDYRILFMQRDLGEILASQAAMLQRHGTEPGDSYQDLAGRMRAHLQDVQRWLESRPNMHTLHLDHGETLRDPLCTARSLREFLQDAVDAPLDPQAMAGAVDASLHRQRAEQAPKAPASACLHLSPELYDRLAAAASSAGMDDVNEFAALILEQAMDQVPAGDQDPKPRRQALRERLESLGYL
jgi:hypothetical protein